MKQVALDELPSNIFAISNIVYLNVGASEESWEFYVLAKVGNNTCLYQKELNFRYQGRYVHFEAAWHKIDLFSETDLNDWKGVLVTPKTSGSMSPLVHERTVSTGSSIPGNAEGEDRAAAVHYFTVTGLRDTWSCTEV
jgi:hypothetical protein